MCLSKVDKVRVASVLAQVLGSEGVAGTAQHNRDEQEPKASHGPIQSSAVTCHATCKGTYPKELLT